MDVAEKNEKKLRRQMRTTSKILLGFLLAILTGAVLLTLPVATVSGKSDFLTALFTATTSVCSLNSSSHLFYLYFRMSP
jgi:trk system potassium uptake protein TrkH